MTPTGVSVTRVFVDVMLKPEILDPQGQAVLAALPRLGVAGVRDVRAGKHFVLDVDDTVTPDTVREIADALLANPVIEDFAIRTDAESGVAE
jgi:phosphoribosylformylglycinamidine synthase PurS subunit